MVTATDSWQQASSDSSSHPIEPSSLPDTGISPETYRKQMGVWVLDSALGYVDAVDIDWWQGQVDSSSVKLPSESNAKKIGLNRQLSTAEQIALVVDTLGFNKREVAELFGVSRQTIYDWLKGGKVSEANATTLEELTALLLPITAGTRRPLYGRYTTRPLSPGTPSILDLLRQRPWDYKRLREMLYEARVLTEQHQAQTGSRRKTGRYEEGELNLVHNLLSLGEE